MLEFMNYSKGNIFLAAAKTGKGIMTMTENDLNNITDKKVIVFDSKLIFDTINNKNVDIVRLENDYATNDQYIYKYITNFIKEYDLFIFNISDYNSNIIENIIDSINSLYFKIGADFKNLDRSYVIKILNTKFLFIGQLNSEGEFTNKKLFNKFDGSLIIR